MYKWLIVCLILTGWNLSAQTKSGSTVAVLEFQKTGAITGDDVQTLTNRFRAMLFQTKIFNVVERQKMKEILKEQEFVMSDECNTNECAVQVGQLLGVEYMIAGDIGLIGDTYTIDLRMIDVSSGRIVQTHSKDYDGKISGLLEIMKQIANSFSQFQKSAAQSRSADKAVTESHATEKEKRSSGEANEKTQNTPEVGVNRSKAFQVRLVVGSAVPSGQFKNDADAKTGTNVMLSFGYYITPKILAVADLGAQTFKGSGGTTYKTHPLVFGGRYYLPVNRINSYIGLGFGTAKIEYDPDGGTASKNSYFATRLGFGAEYVLRKNLAITACIDFTSISSDKKLGQNTTYTQFGLGFIYTFVFKK